MKSSNGKHWFILMEKLESVSTDKFSVNAYNSLTRKLLASKPGAVKANN